MGWNDYGKNEGVFNMIQIYLFKFSLSTFTRWLALNQDSDV